MKFQEMIEQLQPRDEFGFDGVICGIVSEKDFLIDIDSGDDFTLNLEEYKKATWRINPREIYCKKENGAFSVSGDYFQECDKSKATHKLTPIEDK